MKSATLSVLSIAWGLIALSTSFLFENQTSYQKLILFPSPTCQRSPSTNLPSREYRLDHCHDALTCLPFMYLRIFTFFRYLSETTLTHKLFGSARIFHKSFICNESFISFDFLIPKPPEAFGRHILSHPISGL